MIDIETLIPGGVLCLYSAWSYHGLTTQIPQAYHIAVERTRWITLPVFPSIELSFRTQKAYELGVVEAEDITVNKEYHGVRVSGVAHLDTARQCVSMDIGLGDVVTPAPQELAFPTLIDTMPQVEIKAYSLEIVVAKKFHAMIVLSLANSRMKDFFDVYRILVTYRMDSEIL